MNKQIPQPNWNPFRVNSIGLKADAPRSLDTFEGIGDRLRSAAFAERQAREAFIWASTYYDDAPHDLKQAWVELAAAEDRHLDWLLARIEKLQIDLKERAVSDQLWVSLTQCTSAREFALYMASAEERGRVAGVRFFEALYSRDPETAELFRKIAEEEILHIALAQRHFPA